MSGAYINAEFENRYGENRQFVIYDTGIDPNAPRQIFSDYLAPGARTPQLQLWASDEIYGRALYQRSDGAPTVADSITNNSVVWMN
ncbi:MAG: hypothetical protein M3320_06020 [Actinomycetota bacterium]|nr:hypothetical protein [Actinomycetota bacterium]MDQ5808215.1 hypothetical protein [Actinomycetota bacterium]